MTDTDKLDEDEARARRSAVVTWLVRVGFAAEPSAPPALHVLEGRFEIGRGMDPEVRDTWMSERHAEVVFEDGRWLVRDLGSSNGTKVWGERCASAALEDGDVFETGATFWIFRRRAVPALPERAGEGPLATLSPAVAEVAERLRRVARTRVPVLFTGPTGAGKEVFARELHRLSGRAGPFAAVNAGALQRSLAASELFGVERGAHSMAEQARKGQVRAASGGTLLLDEVADTPPEVQVGLLRAIQEGEVVPVGADAAVKVDVRFAAATNRDLEEAIAAGAFREDLYARINGVNLAIPPLAERAEDLGLLVGALLERYGGREGMTAAAYRAVLTYGWPRNVRELEKAVERAVAMAGGAKLEVEHLPPEVTAVERRARKTSPRAELERLLVVHEGNVSAVARTMGRSRVAVHRMMRAMGLDAASYR